MEAKLTPRRLNRATLERQLLLRREALDPVEAVRRLVALQAQEPASVYLALWTRLADFEPADLDAGLADQRLLKATLMRITLHVLHADDYPALHEAMQPMLRAARLNDGRFRAAGLSVEEYEALVPQVIEFASSPRTNAEVEAWLDERLGELPKPSVWWAMRHVAPFVHAPTGGPWSFGQRPSFRAAPRLQRSGDWEAAMRVLVRRYLAGFGPATLDDVAQFGMFYRTLLRPVIDGMADELVRLAGPGRGDLLDLPGAPLPGEDTPAPPRLLPMWDSVLLAYADRARIIPAEYRKLVTRSNGDVLPTLLVDGYVAGVWRPVEEGIEATAFRRLPHEAWTGLDAEARMLRDFLAPREPMVYRRYARWWVDLPAAEVRVLGQ